MLFVTLPVFADSHIKEIMESNCEELGAGRGAECVQLQRKLIREKAYIDQNGASICSLIWQWASRSGNTDIAAGMVLSCLKQIVNLQISDETQETCNRTVYMDQGSITPMQTIQLKVKKMMDCIKKLGVPVTNGPSR